MPLRESGPSFGCELLEDMIAKIAEEDAWSFQRILRVGFFKFWVYISSDPEDVRQAIVVEVCDRRAPADIPCLDPEAR